MAARRRRPTGDDATNARKRFYRAAERYLKQAAASAGATAARYRELARKNLSDAVKTYSAKTTQTFSKPMQRIANALGVDLNRERERIKAQDERTAETSRRKAIDLGKGSKSHKALEGVKRELNAETLRQDEARVILNSEVGKRILAGTVDIWKDAASVSTPEGVKVDKSKILPALYKHFNVDNLADLLDKMEDIAGEMLYQQGESETMYETAKLTIQNRIATDNSMAA